MENKRIHSLDSVRGVAALIVVIYHTMVSFNTIYNAQNHQIENPLIWFLTYTPLHNLWAGHESVLLFFVLSGFVLAIPYLAGKNIFYPAYLIKRVCRIYLPYLIIMLIYIAAMFTINDYSHHALLSPQYNGRWDHPVTMEAFWAMIFMSGIDIGNINGVTWSLIHEMRISIIFPLIAILVWKNDFKKILLFALVIPNLIWLWMQGVLPGIEEQTTRTIWAINGGTVYYSAFFFYGAVLAKHKDGVINKIKKINYLGKGILFMGSMILISFRWTFYWVLLPYLTSQNKYFFTIFEDTMIASGIVLLLALVLSSRSIHSFLTTKPMLWLGKVSYSLYLVHVLVIMFCGKVLSDFIPLKFAIPFAIILTLPLAGFTYRFIEAPAMSLGKKLANKMISLKG